MESIILEFDKREISTNEIIEHIDYYINKSNEARSLRCKGDIKAAREIFKDLRNKLKAERDYYNKNVGSECIIENPIYMNYITEIDKAYVNQINPNSNETLGDNLYDIESYMSYCKHVINIILGKEL